LAGETKETGVANIEETIPTHSLSLSLPREPRLRFSSLLFFVITSTVIPLITLKKILLLVRNEQTLVKLPQTRRTMRRSSSPPSSLSSSSSSSSSSLAVLRQMERRGLHFRMLLARIYGALLKTARMLRGGPRARARSFFIVAAFRDESDVSPRERQFVSKQDEDEARKSAEVSADSERDRIRASLVFASDISSRDPFFPRLQIRGGEEKGEKTGALNPHPRISHNLARALLHARSLSETRSGSRPIMIG